MKNSNQHKQLGFLRQRSTVTELLTHLQKVCEAYENIIDYLAVYFDIKKALNSTPTLK